MRELWRFLSPAYSPLSENWVVCDKFAMWLYMWPYFDAFEARDVPNKNFLVVSRKYSSIICRQLPSLVDTFLCNVPEGVSLLESVHVRMLESGEWAVLGIRHMSFRL